MPTALHRYDASAWLPVPGDRLRRAFQLGEHGLTPFSPDATATFVNVLAAHGGRRRGWPQCATPTVREGDREARWVGGQRQLGRHAIISVMWMGPALQFRRTVAPRPSFRTLPTSRTMPVLCRMLIPADPLNAFVADRAQLGPHAADGPLAGPSFAAEDIFDVVAIPLVSPRIRQRLRALPGEGECALAFSPPSWSPARAPVGKTLTAELAFRPHRPGQPGRDAGYAGPPCWGAGRARPLGLPWWPWLDIALGSDTGGVLVRAPAPVSR